MTSHQDQAGMAVSVSHDRQALSLSVAMSTQPRKPWAQSLYLVLGCFVYAPFRTFHVSTFQLRHVSVT